MNSRCPLLLLITVLSVAPPVQAKPTVLDAALHHLRVGAEREWSDFPQKAEALKLALSFQAERNAVEWTLRLRQQGVKQTWKVLLNGKELTKLPPDPNDMVLYLPLSAGALQAGENKLAIEQIAKIPNDVRIGEITLDDRPLTTVLSAATVEITVRDASRADRPTPCRLTIVNDKGALMTTSAVTGGRLAVRPGVIYTGDGQAQFGLPPGEYTIYAGRGFAYGIDSVKLSLRAGDKVRKTLTIRREVTLDGWVSSDTHVHTLTHSGHGDSTDEERVITLAGEGIELPIITDHNKQIDLDSVAVKLGVRDYFTPVVGNEVTTSVGHFNIFPVRAGGPLPEYQGKEWASVFKSIAERTGAKAVILNHPRDLHSGFRPFGAEHHLALTGDNLDGWELKANAMEVVNSGAQQTDVMRPLHDWMALLNRGLRITPVGASDSHDVSRSIVGQARTYIRCKSDNPGALDVDEATKNFVEGRVLVSCGLLAQIIVNDKYGPGDLVPATGDVKVAVRVLGPAWTTADRVELYANGRKIREEKIADGKKAGVKWSGDWTLPRFKHDVHLVAIASGPGVTEPYWPIQRPYQPMSPVADLRVLGATGAVWLDADGDGKRTSARVYAERLLHKWNDGELRVMAALMDYDEAVAAQAAAVLQAKGISVSDDTMRAALAAGKHVLAAFEAYAEALRNSQIARGSRAIEFVRAADEDAIFERDAKLTVLAGKGAAGEGPAWHPKLGVLTSGNNGHIYQFDLEGKSRIYRKDAGTNGLLFDAQGRLLACEPTQRRITRTELDGKITVLTDKFEGKRYNEANDLTVDSQGRIYFSDPRYGTQAGKDIVDEKGRTIEGVYRIDLDGKVARVLGREVERANGVLVSGDDKYLYVADNNNDAAGGARKLWRFDLKKDGTVAVASKKLLYDWDKGRGPDGVKHDVKGRLYVAAGLNKPNPPFEPAEDKKGGIYVFSPEGKLLTFLPVPTDEVTNCAFGGDDRKTLYITGGGTLYSIRTTTPGRVVFPAAK